MRLRNVSQTFVWIIPCHQWRTMVVDVILFILMIGFTAYAIFSHRLLNATVSLGLSSALLAIIFFRLYAPFAAGFELSVGAGLISLLFIMAISLARKGKS